MAATRTRPPRRAAQPVEPGTAAQRVLRRRDELNTQTGSSRDTMTAILVGLVVFIILAGMMAFVAYPNRPLAVALNQAHLVPVYLVAAILAGLAIRQRTQIAAMSEQLDDAVEALEGQEEDLELREDLQALLAEFRTLFPGATSVEEFVEAVMLLRQRRAVITRQDMQDYVKEYVDAALEGRDHPLRDPDN